MKLLTTFFLGLITACTALIVQVFLAAIVEIFTGTTVPLHYTPSDTIGHVVIFMIIAAIIEETLRYIIIKKKIVSFALTYAQIYLYGILFGIGFVAFEVFMASFNRTAFLTTPLFMFFAVFFIHIILSIFFMIVTKRQKSTLYDLPFIIFSVIIHTGANTILFFLFT